MVAKVKDIGIDVNPPAAECDDTNCPFHGSLPVRGQMIDGTVVSIKMDKTAVVERKYLKYQKKYERYEKRTSRYSAHAPECLALKVGDNVTIMECRPISKTVSFVIVDKKGE
ncbi:MAG: 30S ribosomal protein S17 [Methanomassiliicoccaceae archaeon]|jgi:small subunit ribosomal protein S17|nr:30S ribosomal protein S17 [Methanomassiliicoccaceae archaeon]